VGEEKVVDFQGRLNKKRIDQFMAKLDGIYGLAADIAAEFSELLAQNPLEAIEKLPEFIDRTRDINENRAYVEAVAGGPNQDWSGPLLGLVGTVYPDLTKEEWVVALRKVLDFLDRQNYINAQDHVREIQEPLLIGDIILNRPLYWPGFEPESNFLRRHNQVASFRKAVEKREEDFWLAFATIRVKYASLPVRQWFYRRFPSLVARTIEAAGAIICKNMRYAEEKGEDPEEELQRQLAKYDPDTHPAILEAVAKQGWVLL